MNRLWDRLGASRPFTWQSVVWMGLGVLFFSPRILLESLGLDLSTWRGVVIVTVVGQGVLTYLVTALIVKRRTIADAPALIWVLLVALSFAFPLLFRFSLVTVFQLGHISPGFFRFFTAAFIWMLGTLVFAVAVSDTRAFQTELGRLKAQLAEEQRLEAIEKRSLEQLRAQIVDEVREVLRSSFAKMFRESNQRNVPDQLDALIDEVVRPLANQLRATEGGLVEVAEATDRPVDGRVRLTDVLSRLTEHNPFEYVLTPFLVSFLTLFMKTWNMPFQTAVWSSALSLIFAGLLLFGCHTMFEALRRRRRVRLSFAGLMAIFLAISFLNTIAVRSLLGIEPSAATLMLVFFEFGVLVLVAVIRAVPLQRQRVIHQLAATLEATQWITSRLAQMNWVEHQKFARLVHGDIQARILATSLQGRIHAPHDALSTAQLVELQTQCEAALTAPLQSGSFASFIDSLTLIWQASVTISHDLSDEMTAAIDADPIAHDAVVEIVREALNNAVKHAGATQVTISGRFESPDAPERDAAHSTLMLTVRSNAAGESDLGRLSTLGPAGPGQSRPGQGTAMFDQLSSEWSLELAEGSTILTARIPTGQVTAAH